MRPFDERAACPKCGCRAITTTYDTGSYPFGPPAEEGKDSLKRRCSRCGYTWHEAPLDRKGRT